MPGQINYHLRLRVAYFVVRNWTTTKDQMSQDISKIHIALAKKYPEEGKEKCCFGTDAKGYSESQK